MVTELEQAAAPPHRRTCCLMRPACGASDRTSDFRTQYNGKSKRTGYEKEIEEKSLNYLYRSFTVETFGAFGEEAWKLVTQCCGRDHPHASDDACMWRRPDPKKDFVLAVGFAIQRGCANTLLRAASRRKSRRSSSPVDPALLNPRGEIDA